MRIRGRAISGRIEKKEQNYKRPSKRIELRTQDFQHDTHPNANGESCVVTVNILQSSNLIANMRGSESEVFAGCAAVLRRPCKTKELT